MMATVFGIACLQVVYHGPVVWRQPALLVAASLLIFFAGLGRAAVSDSDEAYYAESAREMVESGDWLTPRYNYEVRFQKPILYYWLAAAAFEATGVHAAAARLPAACSGLIVVLVTWAVARRWVDPRAAAVAGLVSATNFGIFALGRMGLPDLPLAAFMTVATWAGFEATLASATGRPAAAWTLLAAATAALAVLAKGPVGLVLPAATVALGTWLGLAGPRRALPIGPPLLGLALIVFTLVAAPWYVAMVQEHGLGYLHRFFVAENLERFATDRYNEPRSVFFYVPIVIGGLLPWSPFMLLWTRRLVDLARRRGGLSPVEGRLVVWAAVPLVFYSLSVGKQPRYVLPALPPLALLLGATIGHRIGQLDRRRRAAALGAAGTAAGAALILAGALLLRARPLLTALSPEAATAVALVSMASGLILAVSAWTSPGQRHLPASVAGAATVTLLAWWFSIFAPAGAEPVQQMAQLVAAERGAGEPVGTHRVFVRNLIFYTGAKQTDLVTLEEAVEFLRRPERVLVVLRERDLDTLEAASGLRPRRLGRLTYFDPAGLRLGTLLHPRPRRDLEVVHLISNR
jgi:4-amino-4-deoxy-L-arabinose transferase-like glycosyltransferase